jgi:putative spermidine/putrescine transport system substrate-binding protein
LPQLKIVQSRAFYAATIVCIAVATVCLAQRTRAAGTNVPPVRAPITLSVVDVAGNFNLTRDGIWKYWNTHPRLVDNIVFTSMHQPELAAKLKAEQDAGVSDIDLVLTGLDDLAIGIDHHLYRKEVRAFSEKVGDLKALYIPPAYNMQKLAEDYCLVNAYYPSGPLIEYLPERVSDPPTSAQALLAWAQAHPGRFEYATPPTSGPGRTFLMALPYLLRDKNPKDPMHGWDKTWAFLKQLDGYVKSYPPRTGQMMSELGDGTVDLIVSTTGWDIQSRVLGVVPKEAEVGTFRGWHWVTDAQYMCIPNGVPPDHVAVVLDLMAYLLKPRQQAMEYRNGFFYPGPAVRGVTLAMAPRDIQAQLAGYVRPEYDKWIPAAPKEVPLDAKNTLAAMKKWTTEIGAAKGAAPQAL